MILKGMHISHQAHYQHLLARVYQDARDFNRTALGDRLDYLYAHIHESDMPNVVICLIEAIERCLEVMPIFEAHPEWADTTPIQTEFIPYVPSMTHKEMVERQMKAEKKRQKRREMAGV